MYATQGQSNLTHQQSSTSTSRSQGSLRCLHRSSHCQVWPWCTSGAHYQGTSTCQPQCTGSIHMYASPNLQANASDHQIIMAGMFMKPSNENHDTTRLRLRCWWVHEQVMVWLIMWHYSQPFLTSLFVTSSFPASQQVKPIMPTLATYPPGGAGHSPVLAVREACTASVGRTGAGPQTKETWASSWFETLPVKPRS